MYYALGTVACLQDATVMAYSVDSWSSNNNGVVYFIWRTPNSCPIFIRERQ